MNSLRAAHPMSKYETIANFLGVFVVYGSVVFLSSLFTFEPSSTPLFWPANALALGIMLYSTHQRAMIYLAASFLSYYVYLVCYDSFGFGPSFLLAGANAIEIAAGYFLVRRFVSHPLEFNRLQSTVEIIVFGVIFTSIVGAFAGTLLMYSVWEAPTLINWSIWFGTAAIGYLIVLPIIISWFSPANRKYAFFEIAEMLLILVLLLLGSIFIFGADKSQLRIYPYIAFPVLLWSGIRFDLRVTSIAFLIFFFGSAVQSTQGLGPFAMGEFYREILLVRFHLYCGITMITVLIVSALVTERKALTHNLQNALSQIKTLSGFIPICSYCKKIRDDAGFWNSLENYIHKHSDAQLSHGICPDCAQKHYGDLVSEIDKAEDHDKKLGLT